MQSFAVNRDALATTPGLTEQARAGVLGVLDGLDLPDRTPFVIEDDGSFTGCWPLNQYVLDALANNGVGLHALRYERMPVLKRFTEWLRTRPEGSPRSEEDALGTDTRTASPLTAARRDLVKFRAHRSNEVAASTLDKEMGYLSGFFDHAARHGWIAQSPVPRWGKRNTLLTGGRVQRRAKFLTAAQSSHFLTAGLRGEGDAPGKPPAYPERDYAYGLLLASTGLRRNEGAYLLDNEIPPRHDFSPDGIHTFWRTGKKGVTRTVYVTQEVAGAVDLYRAVERDHMIETAQPRLRRLLREEQLLRLDEMTEHRGEPAVVLNGKVVPTTALDERQRRRAVLVRDTGRVEPAGLLITQLGLPATERYWNELFAAARDRVHLSQHQHRPPAHISVSPHTMRHTFAVRMLAILMRDGERTSGNPYQLLASPVLTVKELLGHADVATTFDYLYAAETWLESVPAALTETVRSLLGREDVPA